MLHTLYLALVSIFAQWGLIVLIGVVFVLFLKWLSGNKADIKLVTGALSMSQILLGDKLGARGGAVFRVWLDALNSVNNNPNLTWDEMADEFVKFVNAAMLGKQIALTPVELNAVREVAKFTMQSTDVKSKSTQRAVKILSLEQD